MFYVVPRVGSGNSSEQQAKRATGHHNRRGNCPIGTDSPNIWAVVGEMAYLVTVGQLSQFYSNGKPVLGEFKYELTISKDNGAAAFVRRCNSLFSGANVKVSANGGSVKMTGEMQSGRKERLAMPYTLTYKRCTVQVMEDKDLPENVSKWMKR